MRGRLSETRFPELDIAQVDGSAGLDDDDLDRSEPDPTAAARFPSRQVVNSQGVEQAIKHALLQAKRSARRAAYEGAPADAEPARRDRCGASIASQAADERTQPLTRSGPGGPRLAQKGKSRGRDPGYELRGPEGCANSVSSGELVLVDEAAESGASLDSGGWGEDGTDPRLGRFGWCEIERAVRPVGVVGR